MMRLEIFLMMSFVSSSHMKVFKIASDFFGSFIGKNKDYDYIHELETKTDVIKKFQSEDDIVYHYEDYPYAEDYSYVEEDEVDYEELFEEYKKEFEKIGKEFKKVGDKVGKEIKHVGDKVRKYEEKLISSVLDTVSGKLYKKIDEKKWLFDTLFHLWLGILEAKKELLYKLWLKKKGKKGRSNNDQHYEFIFPYYSSTYKPYPYHMYEEPKVHYNPNHHAYKHKSNPQISGNYVPKQDNQHGSYQKSDDNPQHEHSDDIIIDQVISNNENIVNEVSIADNEDQA